MRVLNEACMCMRVKCMIVQIVSSNKYVWVRISSVYFGGVQSPLYVYILQYFLVFSQSL